MLVETSSRHLRIDVIRATCGDGLTDLALSGGFGPAVGEGAAHYFFQLASGGSYIAPQDSAENAMTVALLVSGEAEPNLSRIEADRIVVSTAQSEVLATMALDFPEGGGSGLDLSVNVAGLPTAYAKNLWPWFAASGARAWTSCGASPPYARWWRASRPASNDTSGPGARGRRPGPRPRAASSCVAWCPRSHDAASGGRSWSRPGAGWRYRRAEARRGGPRLRRRALRNAP